MFLSCSGNTEEFASAGSLKCFGSTSCFVLLSNSSRSYMCNTGCLIGAILADHISLQDEKRSKINL